MGDTNLPLKSHGDLAGTECVYKAKTHACGKFARYAVTWLKSDGTLVVPLGVCGQHLSYAIRDTWTIDRAPAVVQEIPGTWRLIHDNDRYRMRHNH